jgi:hypothetical protein
MDETIPHFSRGVRVEESRFRDFPEAFEAKRGRFGSYTEVTGVKEEI